MDSLDLVRLKTFDACIDGFIQYTRRARPFVLISAEEQESQPVMHIKERGR